VAPCEGKEQYRRWVREDVAYIISTDERFAFTALESEAACDAFIERFWAQRGAAFRQEHARRLAYVNKHYSAAVPGWRTDRGRIYILYGPPDRIESHPGSQESVAIEKWNYRHLPSIGDNITIEFIDRAGDGDYRMVYLPDPPSRAAMQQRQDLAEVVREERLPNGLAVRVHLDRTALISVPVDWSFGDANLYGRITDKSRRSVWVFEETVRIPTNAHSGTAYITMREKRLDPGTYRLQIVAKPLSRERSAEAKRHELQFKVN
jgi:GWxTD domain-containing protein